MKLELLAKQFAQHLPRSSRGRRAVAAVLVAAVVIAVIVAGAFRVPAHAASAEPVPDAVWAARARALLQTRPLRGLAGDPWHLADFRGDVVVVNFWASWCRPCQRELPRLDALSAEIAKRGGRVFAVSIDTDAANVRRFMRAHRLSLPILHDGPTGIANALELDRVPFTLVLDRAGEIAYATSGAETERLEQVVRELVARPYTAVSRPGSGR